MNVPEGGCSKFRSALEFALRAEPGAGGTHGLTWHEHLLGCAECQALLRSESALDEILASMPAPCLPPDLTTRVLAGLRASRLHGSRIDERIDERLDALLDLAPAPSPPVGLTKRVLAGLEPRRREPVRQAPGRFTLLRGGRRRVAAAALMLTLGAALVWQRTRALPAEPAPVEEGLLAQLEVLENWDALMSDDLDLYLASLDSVEWTLLELEAEEAQADEEEGG